MRITSVSLKPRVNDYGSHRCVDLKFVIYINLLRRVAVAVTSVMFKLVVMVTVVVVGICK